MRSLSKIKECRSAPIGTLAILILSAGCVPHAFYTPPADCTTRCGLRILAPTPPLWCSEVQLLEDRALRAFARLVTIDQRFSLACQRLAGWTVTVLSEKNLPSSSEGRLVNGEWVRTQVGGETRCLYGSILVGDNSPMKGRLAHELAHAVERCEPRLPLDPVDPLHSGWGPIYAALKAEGLPE